MILVTMLKHPLDIGQDKHWEHTSRARAKRRTYALVDLHGLDWATHVTETPLGFTVDASTWYCTATCDPLESTRPKAPYCDRDDCIRCLTAGER